MPQYIMTVPKLKRPKATKQKPIIYSASLLKSCADFAKKVNILIEIKLLQKSGALVSNENETELHLHNL